MKLTTIFLFSLLAVIPCLAQHRFLVSNPSKTVSVDIDVAKCDNIDCHGPAKFSFSHKGDAKPFQVVSLRNTQIMLGEDGKPQANVTLLYDEQSVVNFGDFNFDGHEDVAVCDGGNGGYGSPTYRVYIYSSKTKRYVYSPSISALAHGDALGMFEVDAKKKMLMKMSKSGCCWHQTEGFIIVGGQPRKAYELTEDVTDPASEYVKVTTKKFVKGKWVTTTKKFKVSEYYKN